MIDQIAAFVTSAARTQPQDRVLATVLCARIEDEGKATAGNRAEFEAHVQQEVAWFRGRGLTFTADGFFAAFDGPARAISCARGLAAAAPRFGRTGSFGLHTGECDVTPDGRLDGATFDRARTVCGIAATGDVLGSRAGDVISVRSEIVDVGNKSVRIAHEMRNDDTGETVASMIVVGVHLDAVTRKSVPLPRDVCERMHDFDVELRTAEVMA